MNAKGMNRAVFKVLSTVGLEAEFRAEVIGK